MKYLGLPIGASPKRIQTWQPVVDGVKKKLKQWKKRQMSMAGRLALVKSTLSNLPIYYMSLFKIPVAVANSIEKLQRQFLWGDLEDKKRVHLVKWDKITKSKEYGGLGVKRIMEHNSSLLAKWWWRFNKEKEALWVQVISRKYNLNEEAWLPQIPRRGRCSVIWKDICYVGSSYASSDIGSCINQGFAITVNSGSRVKFWVDKWLGEKNLLTVFPRLYSISTQKEAMVDQIAETQGQGWNFQFRRPLRTWEGD